MFRNHCSNVIKNTNDNSYYHMTRFVNVVMSIVMTITKTSIEFIATFISSLYVIIMVSLSIYVRQ